MSNQPSDNGARGHAGMSPRSVLRLRRHIDGLPSSYPSRLSKLVWQNDRIIDAIREVRDKK